MDSERLGERARFGAEVYGIRARSWIRTTVQVLGLACILLGAYNMLAVRTLEAARVGGYQHYAPQLIRVGTGEVLPAIVLADVVLICAGAAIAWVAS